MRIGPILTKRSAFTTDNIDRLPRRYFGDRRAESNRHSLIRMAKVTRAELTKREAQILELLLEGKADKEIAVGFDISVRTVRFHISNIFKKKGLRTRAELLVHELRRR